MVEHGLKRVKKKCAFEMEKEYLPQHMQGEKRLWANSSTSGILFREVSMMYICLR
jgi:hypothetical protein